MKAKKKILDELTSFSWKDLSELIKNGEFKDVKRPLSKETYEFIAKAKNYTSVVETAYVILQKNDPENANLEYAVKVADTMQEFARRLIKEDNVDKN